MLNMNVVLVWFSVGIIRKEKNSCLSVGIIRMRGLLSLCWDYQDERTPVSDESGWFDLVWFGLVRFDSALLSIYSC